MEDGTGRVSRIDEGVERYSFDFGSKRSSGGPVEEVKEMGRMKGAEGWDARKEESRKEDTDVLVDGM